MALLKETLMETLNLLKVQMNAPQLTLVYSFENTLFKGCTGYCAGTCEVGCAGLCGDCCTNQCIANCANGCSGFLKNIFG